VVGGSHCSRPGQRFQYTSGSQLKTPTGSMKGSYFCVRRGRHPLRGGHPEEFMLAMPRTLH
jgi:ApaG protein